MLLTREFLLLSIDNESGRFVGVRSDEGASVVLLADLVREGYISIEDRRVQIQDDGPTGEWLLDGGLARVKTAKRNTIRSVLGHIAAEWTPLRMRLVEELVADGVLREDKCRNPFIFQNACWPTEDPSIEEETRSRLRRILIAHRTPSTDDLVLITAVRYCGLLEQFIPKNNIEAAVDRVRELTDGHPFYRALRTRREKNSAAFRRVMVVILSGMFGPIVYSLLVQCWHWFFP